MNISGVPSVRPTVRSSLYVVGVTLIAAVGFTEQSPWPILLAALLAVPASIVALPLYYLAYGFLALIPGANPSSNSGSMTFAPDGRLLTSVSTGMPAAWFTITTFVLGILTLTDAAVVNVLLFRALASRRRSHSTPSAGRIVIAVLLGSVYGLATVFVLFVVALHVISVRQSGDNPGVVVNNAPLVILPLFILWQVRREFRRAARKSEQGST